ncbi:MAG: Gfo/Idh/MocA family oxidoreductase, partial [Actinobacteria bacterium]|nr:Gfo/Idh/MocA family oxidoreductase [Actinomycetota bacterium]
MSNGKMSRRGFVHSLLVAAAAPTIIPATALGNNRVPPPSDRITLGHIGVGNRGGSVMQNFLRVAKAQSVAVCDPFKNRREERAKQVNSFYADKYSRRSFKGCVAYNDFRGLLARDDIDAVVIATPVHWHVPIAIAAAKAGKDIYLEKPLGISVMHDKALRSTIEQYSTIFQWGTQQRSGRDFRYACELVRNGRIGKLHTILAWSPDISSQEPYFHAPDGSMLPIPVPEGFDYDMWIGPAPMTPYTSDRCNSFGTYHHYDNCIGFIAGWGAHPLDIAQWGNDSDDTVPVEYAGNGTIAHGGLYETISSWDVWATYQNGVKLHFMSEGVARPIVQKYRPGFHSHGTTFIGSEGWVNVDRDGIYAYPESLLKSVIAPDEIHLYKSNNHYKNFINGVRTRKQPVSTIQSAVQTDIICHLSNICIRRERKIKWDAEKEMIIGDEQAARMLW